MGPFWERILVISPTCEAGRLPVRFPEGPIAKGSGLSRDTSSWFLRPTLVLSQTAGKTENGNKLEAFPFYTFRLENLYRITSWSIPGFLSPFLST